jgi:predicted O-linked N-acetylglucosamine transferase (SPINDLY family)
MPDGYVCYDPPADAPPVAPLPAIERGHVTFASFNNPAKVSPRVIEVWARILRRLPAARLVLQYRGMNERPVAGRLAEMLAAEGVDRSRVDFRGWSPRAESLAQYQAVDLALDPFPFSGSATTCDALWMGVPVVTCPGETFASRHSLSHLSNVGLRETIAGDLDAYVEIAVALAGDLPRLAALRAGLRAQMADAPLCDGRRFAGNLMRLLHSDWAENQRP